MNDIGRPRKPQFSRAEQREILEFFPSLARQLAIEPRKRPTPAAIREAANIREGRRARKRAKNPR